jgi:hypothetical protein
MDLVKLIAELREYRAQIEEAIVALEQLARRRHPGARWNKLLTSTTGNVIPDIMAPSIAPRKRASKKKASKKKSR